MPFWSELGSNDEPATPAIEGWCIAVYSSLYTESNILHYTTPGHTVEMLV